MRKEFKEDKKTWDNIVNNMNKKTEFQKRQEYLEAQKKKEKTVFVTASNFNEELGLLAVALIDKEIKIYYIRQMSGNIELKEYFSFK